MEEEGNRGRWSKQGVGSVFDPGEWLATGEMEEEGLRRSLAVEGEERMEVGSEGWWELRRRGGARVEVVGEEVRSF